MRPVTTDVARSMVCVSVCVSGMCVLCKKRLNWSWACFGEVIYVSRRKMY